MAFSLEEQREITRLRGEGKTSSQIGAYIGANRLGRTSTIHKEEANRNSIENKVSMLSGLSDIGGDIKQTGKAVFGELQRGVEEGAEDLQDAWSGKRNPVKAGFDVAASNISGAFGAFGEVIKGGVKVLLNPEQEQRVKGAVTSGAEKVVGSVLDTKVGQDALQWYDQLPEDQKKDIKTSLQLGEAAFEAVTVAGFKPAFKVVREAVETTAKGVTKRFTSLFPEDLILKNVDDVIRHADDTLKQTDNIVLSTTKQVDDTLPIGQVDDTIPVGQVDDTLTPTGQARAKAEAEAPELTLKEKWIGLEKDVKKQIQGKPKQVQEYLDVVATRNVDPNAPTVMEFAGNKARGAADDMEIKLNTVGNEIGDARVKYGSYKGTPEQVAKIEDAFNSGLEKLGLKVDPSGKVTMKRGTVSKLGSSKDVKAVEEMWVELQTLKESPTLTNIIDYRNFVQKNITFSKSAREISDAIDPFAKNVRAKVAGVAAEIVGKSEAAKLAKYSEFIEAFTDLKSFTDRNAGGEYLLRLVMSGRGGEARTIISTIKTHTGIDLMDDAVMMSVVTDLLANKNQKTLFQKAIADAGIDVARVLSGDPRGAMPVISNFIQEKFLDTEAILKAASQ